jgi:hypothetical protein
MTSDVSYTGGPYSLLGCGDESIIISDFKVFDFPFTTQAPGFPIYLGNFRMQNATILTPVAPTAFPTVQTGTPVTVDRDGAGVGYQPTAQDIDIWTSGGTVIESSGSVVTISAGNAFVSGQQLYIQGMTIFTWLNGQVVTVLATGLSGSQFEFNDPTSHGAHSSASESKGQYSSVSPTQQAQQYGPTVSINLCNYSVIDRITGTQVLISLQDCSYSVISNCNIIGGKGVVGGLGFNHVSGQSTGTQNRIVNNVVKYASLSGVFWASCDHTTIIGNHSSHNGESGLKNWSNAFGDNTYNQYNVIIGNVVEYNYYDGFDISEELNHSNTTNANSILKGNTSSNNNNTGMYGSGQRWIISDNIVMNNGLTGMSLDVSYSVLSHNQVTSNNTRLDANSGQIVLSPVSSAQNNLLLGNLIYGTPSAHSAIYWGNTSSGNSLAFNVALGGSTFSFGVGPIYSVGNSDGNGPYYTLLGGSGASTLPGTTSAGFANLGIGFNLSGNDEIAFMNTWITPTDAFRWYAGNGASSYAELMGLSGTGNLSLPGTGAGTGHLNLNGKITQYSGQNTAGNGVASEVSQILATGLSSNYNGGTAKTLFTPTAAGMWRICFSQAISRAAATSSTFPSLTLGWTDPGGVARTKQIVSTSTANTTSVEVDGTTIIYTNGSTAVTITSSGYTSVGGTAMTYALAVTAEAL